MTTISMTTRLGIAAAAALIAMAAWGAGAQAQQADSHWFLGSGLSEGDMVGLGARSATADASGDWLIETTSEVAEAADERSFTLNGQPVRATLTPIDEDLTRVALVAAPTAPGGAEDGLADQAEDSIEGEQDGDVIGGDKEDALDEGEREDDDGIAEPGEQSIEGEQDGEMMDGEEDGALIEGGRGDEDGAIEPGEPSREGEQGSLDRQVPADLPTGGSGGLADGDLPAGLIGLLIALGLAAAVGFGYRRVRRRT